MDAREWIESGKAILGVSFAEDLHHPLQLRLLGVEQLHKTGQGPGLDNTHGDVSLLGGGNN